MLESITQSTFQSKVIGASFERPVLVDFWATWCGPCQSLAPILEALASSFAGRLEVVKVDTDAESDIAAQFGIRSLPSLLLFRNGETVDQLVGAQPQSTLEQFVQPWLPKDSDGAVESAREALDDKNPEGAIQVLEAALAVEPEDYRIHPLLAAAYLDLHRTEDAQSLLDGLPANIAIESEFDAIRSRIRMALASNEQTDDDDEVSHAYSAAVNAASREEYDVAVSGLLGLLPRHRDWNDGAVRTALLDVFNVLGPDPRVRKWRTQMSRALN